MLTQIKLDETTKIEFGVQISGASGAADTRFVIESKDFSIVYPCTTANGMARADIAPLNGILPAGEYTAKLEIVIENKLYTPLVDKILIEPLVEVKTSVPSVSESIKVVSVLAKVNNINENLLRKTQAATIIAQSLNYKDIQNKTPDELINAAIQQAGDLTLEQTEIVRDMLKLAEEVGIQYDTTLFESEEWSDTDLDKMAAEVDDWDDIVDLYGPGELHIVDTETGEHVDDLKDELKEGELNEVLSRVERIRARIRFHKSAAKRERKLKVALHKHSDNKTIEHRARTLAVKMMKTKLARKPPEQMSVAEKERVEKIVAKRKAVIDRMALKLTQRIRTIEKQRLSA